MHTWQLDKKKSLVDFETGKRMSLKFIKNKDKILDIGCGDARFFDIVKEKYKCSFYGYDIEKSCKKIVEKKGYTFLSKLNLSKKYNVISMFEVIEHLDYDNFIKMMKNVDKMLKKGGMLILSTPNFANVEQLNHFWDNVQHIRPYNVEALKKYFGKTYSLKCHKYFCRQLNPLKIIRNLYLGFKPFFNQIIIFKKN